MSSTQESPVILVDGSSYLFRAYYAMPPLTNGAGLPTGAIYGVINMLKKLIKDYSPTHLAVIFDPKGKTTRHELYADYKANRASMPEDLQQQIAPLHAVIRAMGIPLFIESGVEADDLIGTIAKKIEREGYSVLISTGDKDIAQLVSDRITLINTMNNHTLNSAGVVEKFGVRPDQIIDYLSLVGDTSDNIPGVTKVGPKTAVKWLTQYDSIDSLIQNAAKVGGKVGENLRNAIESGTLALSRQLVTIDCAIDVSTHHADCARQPADEGALKEHFTELEFSAWLAELSHSPSDSPPAPVEVDYQTVLTKEAFQDWVDALSRADVIALDTETTSLDATRAELVGLSFATQSHVAAYVPLTHRYPGAPSQLDSAWVLEQLEPILNDSKKLIVGQNLKYDLQVLRTAGVSVTAKLFDTMIASYVLHQNSMRHDMDTLARKCLGLETVTFESIAGKGAKQLTFDQIDIQVAAPYAAEDADITYRLYEQFNQRLEGSWALSVFQEIEMPLMPILADMEYTGVRLDCDLLHQQSADLSRRIVDLQQQIWSLAGENFNIASTKQLQYVLFEKLMLPVLKKTPKGQPSTAEEVLQELAVDYPLPKSILEFRSLSKLKSTYTDKLPEQTSPVTERVHTHYNQTVTATGRLSSNNPNLQNIPVRTEDGRKIREAFVARPGRKIVAADYSQVELRLMAHLSQDPTLLQAFKNNEDVHSVTAAGVFGVTVDAVTPEQRRRAKAINFGLMYGMSAFGLAKQLGVGRQEAQDYIDVYFNRYPGVHAYMDQARSQAADQGYVETLCGRRLMTPDINSKNALQRRAAERAAINAPLQGSAADIIKLAMINMRPWLQDNADDISLLMQVHDELVFSVKESRLDEIAKQIHFYMENAISLSVDLLVEIGVGDNWEQAH